MRQLLLLRHAKSSWDDPRQPDHARPLNERGLRAAFAIRAEVHAARPQLVLVSSARRTLQTLEALQPWDEMPRVEPLDALYLASAPSMLSTLQELSGEFDRVLLVGHNPGLHELALLLCGPSADGEDPHERRLDDGFPTAALAELSVHAPWSGLRAGGARLLRFTCPDDLSELAP